MGTNRNTVARSLHDLGAAAWFGGTLMGSVGLNGAAADVRDPVESTKVSQAGWARWTPVNLGAIGAHVAGAGWLLWANKGRLSSQKGVLAMSITKTAFTAAALGATAYSRILGEQVIQAGDVPTEGGTTPHPATPDKVAKAQRQLTLLQWTIPALTGGIIVISAYAGEQQRPSQVKKGLLSGGIGQLGKSIAAGALVGQAATTAFVAKKRADFASRGAGKGAGAGTTSWATRAGKAGRDNVRVSRYS